MKYPLVSVIIPVYNVAPYLHESLDSVISQTYHNLEILIVDDGSTDGSGLICDEYSSRDSRITVIHQTHQNVSAARNTALDLATGDYIAFLDPDDAFYPSFVRIMLATILREKTDIVICKYRICHTARKMDKSKRGKTFSSIQPGLYNRAQALEGLLDGMTGVEIWDKLYKRELWKEIRFSAALYAASDHVVSFQAFFNCKSVYVIDRPLYMYRKRPGSLTAIHPDVVIRSRTLARLYVSDFMRNYSPEIFSAQQLRRYDINFIKDTIIYYAKYYEQEGFEELKKQITDMVDKVGMENCGYRTRLAYHMLCQYPWLLKYGCSVYLPIRAFVRIITGR